MILVGLVLLLIGLFAHVGILFWIGLFLILIGLFLNFAPSSGQHVGSRRRYW